MQLTGRIFILRPWQPGDEQSLQMQANNVNIPRFLFNNFPNPYTIADAEKWVARHLHQHPVTNFAIVFNDAVIGAIECKQGEDIYCKNALLGYWLGEEFWGRGITTEAVRLVTTLAFEHLGITRIQANVNGNNPASMRVLEKAGFAKEGILKNAIFKNGEVLDEHIYALLRY